MAKKSTNMIPRLKKLALVGGYFQATLACNI